MARFFILFHRCILRDLGRTPARAALTLSGVALGVAVVVGVGLANDRAIGSFNQSLRLISGQSDLRIEANGPELAETVIQDLAWLWDLGAMTAVIEGRMNPIAADGSMEESVTLLGVDLLADAPFRTYLLNEGGELGLAMTRADFLDLLADPTAVILPAGLARRLDAEKGDVVRFLAAGRDRDFKVAAVLGNEGAARAFGGRIVFMDIAAAQLALDRMGSIDRIEVLLDPGLETAGVARRLADEGPASVRVETPEERIAQTERMTRAFRYNLTALSYIALVVGMILIYNTMNIAVARRRPEIGAWRTLGVSRRMVGGLFLLEAIFFGTAGAILGVWAGAMLERTAGALVSRTIAVMYTGAPGALDGPGPDVRLYLEMILLGAGLAAAAGAGPAVRATRIPPAGVLRGSTGANARRWSLAGAGLLAAGVGLAFAPPLAGFPFAGYAAGVCFMAGFGLLSPGVAALLLRFVRRSVLRAAPAEGVLALQAIAGNLGRVVVAVTSLAIAVAMLISITIMVSSFRDTVIVWVEQTLRGDLYVRPAGGETLDPETLAALPAIPGVAALDRFRSIGIAYDGFPAVLGAGEFVTIGEYGSLLFLDGRATTEVAARMPGADRIVISEPFARRHGVGAGDVIDLATPAGATPFRIEAVFYDYSSDGGLVVMDRRTYLRWFDDAAVSNAAVYLEPAADAETVRREILRRTGGRVRVATHGELREQVLQVFDQTFEVTFALEVIALAVAMLGVANTLAALVLERRPELAMLRFIGAARGQIRRMIVYEAGLIGVLGAGLGLALGVVLSLLLVFVINLQSFGWTIQFNLPAGFLAQSLALILVTALAAGFYPAALALRMEPIEGIRAE